MKNNGERKTTKRHSSYLLKFLMAAVLFFICFNAYAQETMQFDSEAKKLEFIRQMLIKEKYFNLSEQSPPHCRQIMQDFLANKNFKAIEPVVRANSVDDPHMAKWKQCEDYGLGGVNIFHSLDLLGAPPYRWYKIEMDGNKTNGPEDMIYHNQTSEPGKLGETGYTWVDLSNCKIEKGGFSIMGALMKWSRKPDAVYLNALAYYKGQLWAVEFIDGSGFSLMRWIDCKRMETCGWRSTHPSKQMGNRIQFIRVGVNWGMQLKNSTLVIKRHEVRSDIRSRGDFSRTGFAMTIRLA